MRAYAIRIAIRYLLAKKKAFISFITFMAVMGVASGVAVLTTIVGASSGLQTSITEKVVGVNAHVLVMTGGWQFARYEDVLRLCRSIPEVSGAAPFVINERMILKGARTHGVLVKGVDPWRSAGVLDVTHQIARADGSPGSLRDLRASEDAERRLAEHAAEKSARSPGQVDPFPSWGDGLADLPTDDPPPPPPPRKRPPEQGEPGPATAVPDAGPSPAADRPVGDRPAAPGPTAAPPAGRTPPPPDPLDELIAATGSETSDVPPPAGPAPEPGLPGTVPPPAAPAAERKPPEAVAPPRDRAPPPARSLFPGRVRDADLFHEEAYHPELFGAGEGGQDDLAGILDEEGISVAATSEGAAALPGLILGRTLAETLDARIGDVVKIVSPSGSLGIGFGSQTGPSDVSFQIVGIFYSGFNEYDSRLVYIHLREAQIMFQGGDTVTGVELRLRDLEDADRVAADLRSLLAAYDTVEGLEGVRGGFLRTGAAWDRYPSRRWLPRRTAALGTLPATLLADAGHQAAYRVITWKELNKNLFTALWIQKIVLTIVLAVVVGVAAFNIVSTLIMIVLEKKKEIAILKSMGAPDSHVLTVFLTAGTVIGLVGLAIGLGLGWGISAALRAYAWPLDPKVYMIDHLPVDIRTIDYVLCAGIAFVICLVATLVPSWRAARMRPVEGLHYE